ncbi:MAG: DUF2795 domain-containing protein [Candidatus Binatia bacterium]
MPANASRASRSTRARTAQSLEGGDIFFFYRPKLDAARVRGREDVQRFYMVLAPDPRGRAKRVYRLLVLGRKKLPELIFGEQHPERRNWALVVKIAANPEELRGELAEYEYETKTRGTRRVAAAEPVGEGRYALLRHQNHTELAYALELPKQPGRAQAEFAIQPRAGFIVAVKNPDISTPGIPAPPAAPAYPPELRRKFGERRWIDVDDPRFLDHENTQLLLVAAHAGEVEEALGIRIDTEEETARTAEVCNELALACERPEVRKPLFEGDFPGGAASGRTASAPRREGRARSHGPEKAFRCPIDGEAFATRSQYERHRAAAHPPSAPTAADVTRALRGLDFPARKRAMIAHAERNGAQPEVLELLARLPARAYRTAADVAAALGEVKRGGR